jgi:hypothetical protein
MSGDEEDDMKGSYWQLILCGGVLSITSGCITQATLELTKAPFDATTQLANGTTAASSEFTQPLREFTSSTTPGAASINPAKAKKRLQVFTATAYENLRADISRGHGEYLVSLATLAGVPSDSVTQFQSLMQDSYSTMFDDVVPVQQSTEQIVEIAWAAGHGRAR